MIWYNRLLMIKNMLLKDVMPMSILWLNINSFMYHHFCFQSCAFKRIRKKLISLKNCWIIILILMLENNKQGSMESCLHVIWILKVIHLKLFRCYVNSGKERRINSSWISTRRIMLVTQPCIMQLMVINYPY